MNWVVVSALIVCMGVVALLSVLIFYMFRGAVRALDTSHERTTKYTERLIDRIVAGDYQTYKAYEAMETPIHTPEGTEVEGEPTVVMGPDRGGFGSRYGLSAYNPSDLEATETELSSELP